MANNLAIVEGLLAGLQDVLDGEGVDGVHCPVCGSHRRLDAKPVFVSGRCINAQQQMFIQWVKDLDGASQRTADRGLWSPSMFQVRCRQCTTQATIVVYAGPDGDDVAILWSVRGGMRTPATPASVTYYLDQAGRCEAMAARTAAVAMYRGALEQLLFQQGFTVGMLNAKITALEAAIAGGTAPPWARILNPGFMRVIKDLGNGAIHPNDGDITRQQALDETLLVDVRIAMEMLLELVYEQPGREAALLARLQAGAAAVTPPARPTGRPPTRPPRS
jgi:hypothetical protein